MTDAAPDNGARALDLPERIVVGKNGAYWRDYGAHYSMCPVSEDNDPVVIHAIYERSHVTTEAWDRGYARGLADAARSAPSKARREVDGRDEAETREFAREVARALTAALGERP